MKEHNRYLLFYTLVVVAWVAVHVLLVKLSRGEL
jgi:hypothetical protein